MRVSNFFLAWRLKMRERIKRPAARASRLSTYKVLRFLPIGCVNNNKAKLKPALDYHARMARRAQHFRLISPYMREANERTTGWISTGDYQASVCQTLSGPLPQSGSCRSTQAAAAAPRKQASSGKQASPVLNNF